MVFLCQTTIPSELELRTRRRGGDGTSCDAGVKSNAVASLRANPNPAQVALAPWAPGAAGSNIKQSRHHSLREIVTQIRIDHMVRSSGKNARDKRNSSRASRVNPVYLRIIVEVEQVGDVDQAGEDERLDRQLLLPFRCPRDRGPRPAARSSKDRRGRSPSWECPRSLSGPIS